MFESAANNTEDPAQLVRRADYLIQHGWRREHYPPVLLDEAIPWNLTSESERSWNFHLHSLDMLVTLLRAHAASEDSRYLQYAVDISLDWIMRHPPEQAAGNSPYAWYDMAVGKRAGRLAYLYETASAQKLLDEAQQQLLWDSLLAHAHYLSEEENIAFHSNHGYYQLVGQLAMGRRLAHRSSVMRQAVEQAQARLQKILKTQFSSEYVHKEHSPGYHRMVYESLRDVVAQGFVANPDIEAKVEHIEQALSWFVQPDGSLAGFGDTGSESLSSEPGRASERWSTQDMQFWTSKGAVGTPPRSGHHVFRKSGYWIVRKRSGGSNIPENYNYLALNAAFHSRTHKHADDLSFIWWHRGQSILVDAGMYGYIGRHVAGSESHEQGYWYDDPWRMYCESSRAHNCLIFNQTDLPRVNTEPYGSAIDSWGRHQDIYFVQATCRYFGTITHRRRLFFHPGKWLLVSDQFKDTEARHGSEQWFHFAPELAVQRAAHGYRATMGNNTALQVASLLGNTTAGDVITGASEPAIQGWYSPAHLVVKPNPAVCFTQSARHEGAYATLFTVSDTLSFDTDLQIAGAMSGPSRFTWQDDHATHALTAKRSFGGKLHIQYAAS